MKVIIKPAFQRDSDRVHTKELLQALSYKIEQIEKAKSIQHITGLKKLRGYITYYRIHVKAPRQSYRIGAIIKGNTVWLPRRVIYRKFP